MARTGSLIVNLIGATSLPETLTAGLEALGLVTTGTARWELVGGHPVGIGHADITKLLEDGYRPCSVTTVNLSTTATEGTAG